jgi:agmatinase
MFMSIKNGNYTIDARFMGSCDSYADASIIMVGAPMDFTCSFKPGSRFGPQKIRQVSVGLEDYSIYKDKSLTDVNFFDCGDLELPWGSVSRSLELTGSTAKEIIEDKKIPLFIGGEHLISVPIIKKLYEKFGEDLIVLHFDAHADLRDEYLGCRDSHSSVVRRLLDFMPGKNIFQFGIRSGTKEEFDFARENTNLFKFQVYEPLKKVIGSIGERPTYITLDIDVVDPAFANGTGTPEPCGISSAELINSINILTGINLVGFDLVEVSPPYDISDRTALLAAKIIREMILTIDF